LLCAPLVALLTSTSVFQTMDDSLVVTKKDILGFSDT
jgi:hypothetical protein